MKNLVVLGLVGSLLSVGALACGSGAEHEEQAHAGSAQLEGATCTVRCNISLFYYNEGTGDQPEPDQYEKRDYELISGLRRDLDAACNEVYERHKAGLREAWNHVDDGEHGVVGEPDCSETANRPAD